MGLRDIVRGLQSSLTGKIVPSPQARQVSANPRIIQDPNLRQGFDPTAGKYEAQTNTVYALPMPSLPDPRLQTIIPHEVDHLRKDEQVKSSIATALPPEQRKEAYDEDFSIRQHSTGYADDPQEITARAAGREAHLAQPMPSHEQKSPLPAMRSHSGGFAHMAMTDGKFDAKKYMRLQRQYGKLVEATENKTNIDYQPPAADVESAEDFNRRITAEAIVRTIKNN